MVLMVYTVHSEIKYIFGFSRHGFALAGTGSRAADLSIQRAQLPADGRGGRGRQKDRRLTTLNRSLCRLAHFEEVS